MNPGAFRFTTCLLAIPLLLSPYILSIDPSESDSSWTEFAVSAGTGSYAEVTRDCSDGHVIDIDDIPFNDAAVSIDHYVSVFHLGLDAGMLSGAPASELFTIEQVRHVDGYYVNPPGPVFYTTPTVGVNTKYFGLDVGYATPLDKNTFSDPAGIPAGALRIGRSDGFHFRFRLADDLPLITGGPGLGSAGFVFNLRKPRQTLWLGLGAAPYDAMLYGAQLEVPMNDRSVFRLGVSVSNGDSFEFGLSAGARFRL